jgi:pre-mRNA-splicing factor CWC26
MDEYLLKYKTNKKKEGDFKRSEKKNKIKIHDDEQKESQVYKKVEEEEEEEPIIVYNENISKINHQKNNIFNKYDSDDEGEENNVNKNSNVSEEKIINSEKEKQRYDSDEEENEKNTKRYDSDDSEKKRRYDSDDEEERDKNKKKQRFDSDEEKNEKKQRFDSDEEEEIREKKTRYDSDEEENKEDNKYKAKVIKLGNEEEKENKNSVIYRDENGKPISKEEYQKKLVKEKEKLTKVTDLDWSSGIVQKKEKEDFDERLLTRENFSRYEDDKDLNNIQREQIRNEDPMRDYILSQKQKKKKNKKKNQRPMYHGQAPQNRYGILPGYRWDGFDRSNGFEKKFLSK